MPSAHTHDAEVGKALTSVDIETLVVALRVRHERLLDLLPGEVIGRHVIEGPRATSMLEDIFTFGAAVGV